jgi:Na+-transporting NADH:ubiquinone oxidoreductase subunit NqrC
MNEGVQILLERMKTHPEEFVAEAQYGVSKWGQVTQSLQEYLNDEDKHALSVAWKQTVSDEMQRRFTQAVMEELVDPKSEKSQREHRDMVSAGQTHAQSMAMQQSYIARQAAILQVQAAQQQTSSYTSLGGSAQGYLSSLFGGSK